MIHTVVKIQAGQEGAALAYLAHEQGNLAPELVEQLVQLKAALEAESDVASVWRRQFQARRLPLAD